MIYEMKKKDVEMKKQWEGFKSGNWRHVIDVRNFIQKNVTIGVIEMLLELLFILADRNVGLHVRENTLFKVDATVLQSLCVERGQERESYVESGGNPLVARSIRNRILDHARPPC